MSQKFQRFLSIEDHCPWCWKRGLTVSVMKKSILKLCRNRCGYKAPVPKKLLTFEERVRFYDPERFQRQMVFTFTN